MLEKGVQVVKRTTVKRHVVIVLLLIASLFLFRLCTVSVASIESKSSLWFVAKERSKQQYNKQQTPPVIARNDPPLDINVEIQKHVDKRSNRKCNIHGPRPVPADNEKFREHAAPLIIKGGRIYEKPGSHGFHVTVESDECIIGGCNPADEKPQTEDDLVMIDGDVLFVVLSGHYFHFIYDTLMRLWPIRAAGIVQSYPNVTFLFQPGTTPEPFMTEILQLFHFDDLPLHRFISMNSKTKYQVSRDHVLVVPRNNFYHVPLEWEQSYNLWIQGSMRSVLLDTVVEEPTLELFVSRGHYRRAIVREAQLYQELKIFLPNLQSIFPDNYTVHEQAALFANAKLVISPHGAALTNMLFSNWDKVMLIEISGNLLLDGHSRAFPTFRRNLELRRHYILGCPHVAHGDPIDLDERYTARVIQAIVSGARVCDRDDWDLPRYRDHATLRGGNATR